MMDVKKLSNEALRLKLRIATFDADNLSEADAKRNAAELREALQKEVTRRMNPSRGPGKRLTAALGRILSR